jgi:hypothetical protein
MSALTKETGKSARRLLVLAVVMVLGYTCIGRLRFTVGALNQIFIYAWLLVPFLAIRPVRQMHRWPRTVGFVLLIPLLLLSSFLLLGNLVLGSGGREERTQPLQAFQQGSSTIELGQYENGGAVGVHGIYLEQRRLILPGLLLVKPIDFFDSAQKATLSLDGPYTVRVHAEGNYYSYDFRADKAYSLKPRVYF